MRNHIYVLMHDVRQMLTQSFLVLRNHIPPSITSTNIFFSHGKRRSSSNNNTLLITKFLFVWLIVFCFQHSPHLFHNKVCSTHPCLVWATEEHILSCSVFPTSTSDEMFPFAVRNCHSFVATASSNNFFSSSKLCHFVMDSQRKIVIIIININGKPRKKTKKNKNKLRK